MNTCLCFKLRILLHDDGLQRPKHVDALMNAIKFVAFDSNIYPVLMSP